MFLRSFELAHVMWAAWSWGLHSAAVSAAPLLLVLRCLAQVLATGFHRFLARFSGRRRPNGTFRHKYPPPWTFFLLVVASCFCNIVDACSSRSTPKPRPPAPTARPNITFHTYSCPPAYAAWYCLNGATCFTVKIGDSLLYNCECADGYTGARCEYKELDGSYLASQRRFMLESASIAGGATIAVFLVVILCVVVYVHYKRKAKVSRGSSDCVDSRQSPLSSASHHRTPTFGTRWRTSPQPTQLAVVDMLPHDRGDAVDQRASSKVELHQVTTLLPPPQRA